jgi:kynurenine formamidase
VPTYRQLAERTDAPAGSSWNVFGPGDQLGTLNFLTPERVAASSRLVRRGAVFNLDYPLDAFVPPPVPIRSAVQHHIFQSNPNHRDDWLDSFYLQATSQIDGLRHMRHPSHGFYGGVSDENIDVGLPALGIQMVAERGIVGRGVLLDVERYRVETGRPLTGPGNSMITPDDLDKTAAHHDVGLQSGDILLVRTGWAGGFLGLSSGDRADQSFGAVPSPGLEQSESMLAWLWDHHIALVAADNVAVEAYPVKPDSGLLDPTEAPPATGATHNGMMHRPWIALLGLFLGELWQLDPLAQDCADDRRYEFLLSAKPLNLVGGVGSPANAMAIK